MIQWLLFILSFNFVDWKVTHKGRKPNYKIYNSVKFIVGLGIWALYGNFENWKTILFSGIVWAIFEVTSFWLIYPEVRNIWAKKPFLYFDTVEKDSGKVDLFFSSHQELHTVCKLIALFMALLSGILIYHL